MYTACSNYVCPEGFCRQSDACYMPVEIKATWINALVRMFVKFSKNNLNIGAYVLMFEVSKSLKINN